MTTAIKPQYHQGVGRRKTAVAIVRLAPVARSAKPQFVINDRTIQAYFPTTALQQQVKQPLALAKLVDHFSISVKATGGGIYSQAGAVAHGLARALVAYEAALRPVLKAAKQLRRDARMKERRKFGLKKARKAPQWSKR